MGVDRTDHIVYGYKLPYKLKNEYGEIDLLEDKFLSLIEGHQDEEFTLIVDHMSGKYAVFGLKIKSSGDTYEGWDFTHLDIKNLDAEKVKSKYREVFGFKEIDLIEEPHLFIFSHFS